MLLLDVGLQAVNVLSLLHTAECVDESMDLRANSPPCGSVLVELLSHFSGDLLSFLAVSLQVFDLHRQGAVPHHQHRRLV